MMEVGDENTWFTECLRTKEIQSIIKKIQKKQKEKTYGYNDLRDRLGIRIGCPFLSDLSTIDTFLKKNFKVRKEEKKKEKIDFNKHRLSVKSLRCFRKTGIDKF